MFQDHPLAGTRHDAGKPVLIRLRAPIRILRQRPKVKKRRQRPSVTQNEVVSILRDVAEHFCVPTNSIVQGERGDRTTMDARAVAMLALRYRGFTWPQVSDVFEVSASSCNQAATRISGMAEFQKVALDVAGGKK